MQGFAVIDDQRDSDKVAVWVTSRSGSHRASHTNAVTIDRHAPEAAKKVHSLTRSHAVLLTEGSTLDVFPIEGEALTVADIEALICETVEQQTRIVKAVSAYARKNGSKTLVPPQFEAPPRREEFSPVENTATQRAFQTANFLARAWTWWLTTDEQRRRRTIRPRTGESPWIMPEEMGSATIAEFPPRFGRVVQPQALL